MATKDKEPNFWLTLAKLVVVATLVIGGTGFALWYADKEQMLELPDAGSSNAPKDWGIATDSPLRSNR